MNALFALMHRHRTPWLMAAVVMTAGVFTLMDPAWAGEDGKSMDWGKMAMLLLGGLAIFLYGMELMSEALRVVAGDKMRDILARLTTNPVAGVFTGAITTAVIQSSSVTTVIVVGFVTAGLMNLSQALGVIFGANIGTTITAQIVAFKVTKYAMWMIFGGFMMWMLGKEEKLKQYGLMLLGLGLIFHGMDEMSNAMKPLRSYEPFLQMMQTMENPLTGILIAAAFTGLIQSSSATTSIVIVMASQGLVTLPAGIALAFGANIGTTVTAALAAIGKPREAVRAAVAHFGFNIMGVILFFPFIGHLVEFVTWMSPVADASLSGMEKLAAEAPRQIANAHTVFNVVATLVFLPFTKLYAKLIYKLVKDKKVSAEEAAVSAFQAKYLDAGMLSVAPMALGMVRREVGHMGAVVEEMLKGIPQGVFQGKIDYMHTIREMDNQVDHLYDQTAKYLSRIGRGNLMDKDAQEAVAAMSVVTELENIGDIVETHLHHLANMASRNNIQLDPETLAALNGFHDKLLRAYHSSVVGFEQSRVDAARLALSLEAEIVPAIEEHMDARHRQLLDSTDAKLHQGFTLESDILENFLRIYAHIKRVARITLNQEGSTALVAV